MTFGDVIILAYVGILAVPLLLVAAVILRAIRDDLRWQRHNAKRDRGAR